LLELISDFPGAEAEWRAVAARLPHSAAPHYYLASMLERQGRPEEALGGFGECLRRDPEFLPARARLGIGLAARGRISEAIPQLRATLRVDPGATEARLALGQALVTQGKDAQAAEQFREVLRLDPANAEARRALETLPRR
jgi:tetratricopeptide (TPR) repeat protein